MFRKDAGAVEEWSLKNVHECVSRQCEILDEVWDALKPGGVLIYSTCTFNQEENEKNAKWIMEELGAELLPIAHDPSWGIVEGNPGYHFYPHKVKGEGLYMCAFRKNGAYGTSFRIPKSKAPVTKNKVDGEAEMRSWLKHPDRWVIRQQERFMSAYPAKYKELIEYISTQFICISTGFGIGELRGKNVTPQHSLAMLKDINTDKFTRVDLTQEQALAYLRNEALVLPNVAQGIVLVTYEQVPLGFVKNVGNHCNNLYPKEWRIRKL
jgi:NOL1/NOP2/fmu family ribosome biogenesis protein